MYLRADSLFASGLLCDRNSWEKGIDGEELERSFWASPSPAMGWEGGKERTSFIWVHWHHFRHTQNTPLSFHWAIHFRFKMYFCAFIGNLVKYSDIMAFKLRSQKTQCTDNQTCAHNRTIHVSSSKALHLMKCSVVRWKHLNQSLSWLIALGASCLPQQTENMESGPVWCEKHAC